MQDCKAAARIRAGNVTAKSETSSHKAKEVTVKHKTPSHLSKEVTLGNKTSSHVPKEVTMISKTPSHVTLKTESPSHNVTLVNQPPSHVTAITIDSPHPNVYPNPAELAFDKIVIAKTSAQRMREHRARKKAK